MVQYLPTYGVVLIYLTAALLGLVLGSALNCLSYRLAHHEKWAGNQRSACPACGHTLAAGDLVPLFSYLFLRGRCRYCGGKISPRYPLTEALLAVVFMSLVWRFQLTLDGLTAAVLCTCLFSLSLVDLEVQLIPDRFLVIPAVIRCAQLLYEGSFRGLLMGILPGISMAGSVLVISLIMDRILKKDTMGGGDIKLLAVLGMYFPFAQCLLLLIFACVIGILIAAVLMKKKAEAAFPFGPALSIAGWLTLLFGEPLIGWYWSMFV